MNLSSRFRKFLLRKAHEWFEEKQETPTPPKHIYPAWIQLQAVVCGVSDKEIDLLIANGFTFNQEMKRVPLNLILNAAINKDVDLHIGKALFIECELSQPPIVIIRKPPQSGENHKQNQ